MLSPRGLDPHGGGVEARPIGHPAWTLRQHRHDHQGFEDRPLTAEAQALPHLRGVSSSCNPGMCSRMVGRCCAVEVDMTEVVERLDDLGDTVAGLDAAEAGDKAEVMVRCVR